MVFLYTTFMTTLTITLPDIPAQKIRDRAKTEGFRNPEEWAKFLVERRMIDSRKQQEETIKKFALLRASTKPVNVSPSEAKAIKRGREAIKCGAYVTIDKLNYELESQRRETSAKKAGSPSS